MKHWIMAVVLFAGFVVFNALPQADAANMCVDRYGRIVKSTAAGAGIGAVAGAISGESSALKGGLVGAGTGAVVGALDRSDTLRDNPLARRAASGAALGVGTSLITGSNLIKSGLVGAGAGAVYHYGKSRLTDDFGRPIPNCR